MSTTQIIGISGRLYAGKDAAGKIMKNLLPVSPWEQPWEIKKYATKLKQVAALLLGVEVEMFEDHDFKASYLPDEWAYLPPIGEELLTDGIGLVFRKMTVREFLQKLGTDGIRDKVHKDAWVNGLFSDFTKESKWIITDMRFENEADRVRDLGGKTIRIIRPEQLHTTALLHPSETALDNFQFDYEIENSGTLQDLTKEVKKCLEMLDILPIRL